jgi:hypothetical protein
LNALTGWIPERIAIKRVQQNVDSSLSAAFANDEFNPDSVFKMLLERFHQGHCLVTVATGMLSESEAERAGLVPTHAYAMLDVRQIQVFSCFTLVSFFFRRIGTLFYAENCALCPRVAEPFVTG